MIDLGADFKRMLVAIGAAAALAFGAAACGHKSSGQVQGYVEGEYVYVSSALAGTLEVLSIKRGDRVKTGDPLFALENVPEKAAFGEAERRLAQARANLEDARKGKRPSEIASVEAQLKQARAVLALSEKELARQQKMSRVQGATSEQDLDRARSTREQDGNNVARLEADLKTARLGSRTDQVAAAEANMKALEATLNRSAWDLGQKERSAPKAGLVFDTLYRPGEWVAAGRPVVALLPPENIKIRAFVPEELIGRIQPGAEIKVTVDGIPNPVTGKVSYISPKAEYTPPVIYSRESRSKLVFMIEAVFDPAVAVNLHPGQPVDVLLGP